MSGANELLFLEDLILSNVTCMPSTLCLLTIGAICLAFYEKPSIWRLKVSCEHAAQKQFARSGVENDSQNSREIEREREGDKSHQKVHPQDRQGLCHTLSVAEEQRASRAMDLSLRTVRADPSNRQAFQKILDSRRVSER